MPGGCDGEGLLQLLSDGRRSLAQTTRLNGFVSKSWIRDNDSLGKMIMAINHGAG
jgi:hypothetical protein